MSDLSVLQCSMLNLFREGLTYKEVARGLGVTRRAITRRMELQPAFAELVQAARKEAVEIRTRRLWVMHPRRGKRPPHGKGHGGVPRFRYGVR